MRHSIYQIDAFSTRRFAGNPAAVVLLDKFPEDATLLAVAAENNLAETAFLVPEGDDYHVRWFTPTLEVPLCGHATLASAAVVMERLEPGRTVVTFNSKSGPLRVTKGDGTYQMDFPARPMTRIETTEAITAAIGSQPVETWVDRFNYLALFDTAEDVRSLQPDLAAIAALDRMGLIVTATGDGGFDCVSRYFAPAKGIPEDPVTGGAHCGIAPFWAARTGRNDIRAWQASSRGGELRCHVAGDRVTLEGACVFYLEGMIEI